MSACDYFDGTCRVCDKSDKVRNKNLYVFGSEGLDVCHGCEMKIVEFVNKLRREHATARMLKYKQHLI